MKFEKMLFNTPFKLVPALIMLAALILMIILIVLGIKVAYDVPDNKDELIKRASFYNQVAFKNSRTMKSIQEIDKETRSLKTKYGDDLEILGLASFPKDKRELNKAYRQKSKEYHPDVYGSDEMFLKLNEAKERIEEYISKTDE